MAKIRHIVLHTTDVERMARFYVEEMGLNIVHRDKNGPFKSIGDLKKVPGIDAAKIDAKKDRLTF